MVHKIRLGEDESLSLPTKCGPFAVCQKCLHMTHPRQNMGMKQWNLNKMQYYHSHFQSWEPQNNTYKLKIDKVSVLKKRRENICRLLKAGVLRSHFY